MFSIPPDAQAERRAIMALSLVSGIGPGRMKTLIRHFGSAEAALHASKTALQRVSGIGPNTADAIRRLDPEQALEEQEQRVAKCGARWISAWDDGYPALLQELYDPPPYLWMRGEVLETDEKSVAIVGTRRATEYGKRVAYQFAVELARNGWTVISGLAYGIDTAAHEGALDGGGRTMAVLGSGVDVIYPAQNQRLAQRMVESGALLSEFPMGTKPDATNFPRRNRIISGLSRAVLIAEAYPKGGALITAHMANEQNREVFAIPHTIFNPAGAGNHELIRNSLAKLVSCPEELLEELSGFAQAPVLDVNSFPDLSSLNALERKLYDHLSYEPLHIDELCAVADVDSSSALVYLLNLEMLGLVRQMAGKMFYRV